MKKDNTKKIETVSNEELVKAVNKMTQKYATALKALATSSEEEAEEIFEKEER